MADYNPILFRDIDVCLIPVTVVCNQNFFPFITVSILA